MELALYTAGLGKQYRAYHSDRPITFQSAVVKGFRKFRPKDKFWAIRDLDLEIPKGSAYGVVGRNGAGKSTLLRLISGVIKADAGEIRTNGRIGGLLDLGVGFHGDLTGYENAIVNGVIAGMTRSEILNRMDEIIEFSELDDVIHDPLRTYSSGMRMRLGFSVLAHTNPDIMLIDEVLAVGDVEFRQKCLQRIKQFKANNCTILLVSHNLEQIKSFCDEALWLDHGQCVSNGDVNDVLNAYEEEIKPKA
jgi:lipopolysaccharide transport system ATP-binding protein